MILKLCGICNIKDLYAVSKLDIDMIGMVFYKDSPRNVKMISSHTGIIPDYSTEQKLENEKKISKKKNNKLIVKNKRIKRIGVFVDEMPQNIITRVYNYNLDYIQLDGNESKEVCENLRSTISPDIRVDIKIIKTIKIKNVEDINSCEKYIGAVDMFLFEFFKQNTLQVDVYDYLHKYYKCNVPFLLGGDFILEDVDKIKNFSHQQFVGINLSDAFEIKLGIHNIEALKEFIYKIRK